MSYEIHKQTYADGQAYRYHVSDGSGHLCYIARPTGMLLPSPTRLVEFFDLDQTPVGRLQPPDVASWRRGTRYEVFVGEKTEVPRAVIQERWRLVDILLLRLPHYDLQLGKYCYVAQGSRYGAHFYEIFRPRGEEEHEPKKVKVGQIQQPAAGPSYIIETDAAPLRQAPLVLAALVILIDMELHP